MNRSILFLFACLMTSNNFAAAPAFLQEPVVQEPETKEPKRSMESLFEPREYRDDSGNTLNYRLMKPVDYSSGKKYPLVIFLHGAGERGDDNVAQLKHGMKDFADEARRKQYPCYVLAPQCPEGKKWVEVDWSAKSHRTPSEPSISMKLTMEVVRSMIETSGVDRTRIYITGLSMGGYGTWDAIERYPEMFAAAAPICGGGDAEGVEKFVNLPLWAFHGDQDTAVLPQRSRDMIAALKKAGGEPKYTEYVGVGHDSWTATYANPDFYAWLFAQRRKSEFPAP